MKKFGKSILSLSAAAILASSAFAGCGGTEGSKVVTGDVEAVPYDGSKVTVVLYHTMGEALENILKNQLEKSFYKMYPNITVSIKKQGDYDGIKEQISNELTANSAPSIAYCYPDHVALYNIGKAVLPLDDFIASTDTVTKADGTTERVGFTDEQIADFYPTYYEEGRSFGDGKMYTLPVMKSTELMYYNKTYFEQHDFEHEFDFNSDFTWDQLEALCRDVLAYEKGQGHQCIPLGYDSEANWFITMCEQLGTPYTSSEAGNNILFNDERNYAFVKEFSQWYADGLVTTQQLNGGYTSALFTAEADKNEVVSYINIGSSAGAGYQKPEKYENGEYPFEVGITSIPQANFENKKVISQGPSLCLFKKADEQEMAAAWLVAKFITTTVELQASWSLNNGYMSALQSVMDNTTYANRLSKANGTNYVQELSITKSIEQSDYYYVSPAFHGSSEARDQVGVLMQQCFTKYGKATNKDATIKEIFESAVKEIKTLYPLCFTNAK